ncbi:hypothetical protein DV737_g2393, partial [Chaetothyriales sp. CBS 132003]
MGVGEIEGASFRVEPLRRVGEDSVTMRARLQYQSRKRGILESDLLLSTFADVNLGSMSKAQLEQYDRFLDENDWDIYYWATQSPADADSPPTSTKAEAGRSSGRGGNSGGDSGPVLESGKTQTQSQSQSGEWAQTIGTFKPAYRPVPARWKDSEILSLLRKHVHERSAGGILEDVKGVEAGSKGTGLGRMPEVKVFDSSVAAFAGSINPLHAKHSNDVEKNEQPDEAIAEKAWLVDWDGPADGMNPKNMSTGRKWSIVVILAFGSYCVTNTSSLYTTTYDQVDAEFGNSRLVATLGLSLFVFGLGLAPMVLGPLSEFYGRRPVYIFAYTGFFIWLIPCAVAQNIQTMLIARFFDGLCGSAFLSVAGGSVGDMFTKDTLHSPMLIYSASPFLGPGTAPIMGGFINSFAHWRWSFYFLLIFAGVVLIAIVLFVPETYMPVILREKARQKRKESGDSRWRAPIEVYEKSIASTVGRSMYRPFMLLFLEPMCFALCFFSSILLGILYLFFGAYPLVFGHVYGFNLWQTGLTFVGLSVGMVVAIMSDSIWRKHYARLMDKNERETGERKSEPEFRLPPTIVASWFCVLGLFWFAWTIYPSVHWIVPIIGTAFFGFGIILSFSGTFTFLVEAYPLYAASALSANSFARSSFAAAFPLFGRQMYTAMGFHWATSLLGFLTLLMAPFPYLFFIYGKRLRAKSKFGST